MRRGGGFGRLRGGSLRMAFGRRLLLGGPLGRRLGFFGRRLRVLGRLLGGGWGRALLLLLSFSFTQRLLVLLRCGRRR